LLRQRPAKGLLGGMSEVPTTQWNSRHDGEIGTDAAPFPAQWRRCGTVRHVFTHFALDLEVWHCQTASNHAEFGGWWSANLDGEALPTLFRKAIAMALESQT
jgi:A/G-specific adenine glycosylase